MDFRKATDDLCDGLSHEELAKALGVSVASVRQARLKAAAKAHREPPANWKQAVIKLAEQRLGHYRRLITEVQDDQHT